MTRAVLDVNVLVSALISPTGTPAQVLELWRAAKLVLVISEPILDELDRVMAEPRLRRRYALTPPLVARLIRGLRRFAIVAPGQLEVSGIVRDPEDHKVLACAREGGADYLVTGDDDLLSLGGHGSISMISPAAFVRVMADH